MMENVESAHDKYDLSKDLDITKHDILDSKDEARHAIFDKGLSRRIWEELYKIIVMTKLILPHP